MVLHESSAKQLNSLNLNFSRDDAASNLFVMVKFGLSNLIYVYLFNVVKSDNVSR